MIWAQKHFAYAHNIRYVMLMLYCIEGRALDWSLD